MLNPIITYTGGGLQPVYGTEGVGTDSINLAASKFFAQGTVMGQVPGSGSAVNEVQTVTPSGTISGGTFQLIYDGEYTTPLAFNASNAVIQAALEALPSIGVGGCVVAGGPVNTTPTTYTFSNQCGGQRTALLAVASAVTGGGSFAVTETTPGSAPGGYWDAYSDAASGAFVGLATAKRLLQYNCRTDAQGRIFYGTDKNAGDNSHFDRAAAAFYAGTFRTAELVGLDANGVTDLGRLITGSPTTLAQTTTLLRMG